MTHYSHKTVLVLCNGSRILYLTRFELIKALRDRGYTVFISSPIPADSKESAKPGADPFLGIGCRMINTPVDRRGMSPVSDLRLIFAYRRLMREIKPDILLSFTIKPNIYGLRAGLKSGIYGFPTITGLGTSIQRYGWLQRFVFRLYRSTFRRVPKVFFQNRTNGELFRLLGLVRSDQMVTVTGSGVNLHYHQFQSYPDPSEPLRFLFIGRLMAEKGIGEYVEAAERIRRKYPEVIFEVIGGTEEAAMLSLVKNLSDRGVIEYRGYQKDVRPFIGKAGAVVLPSKHEGMANVLLEAAAAGRPVIASNISGCAETFDEGRSGFGFALDDADDLYAKLEQFIMLPWEARKEMGQAARIKVEFEFDRQKVVDTYLSEIDRFFGKIS